MRKRRLFGAFMMIMALIVMLLPAAEADAETSASDFTIKNGELTKYKGKEKTVSVPNTVTVIGESAFENNTVVEKIVLPNSVTQINAYAFWGCENLKTVTLGSGLTSVGDFAFINCSGLETMTIPKNVRSIGIQAFAYCEQLEDITIPPEVTDIREDAFEGDYLLNIHCEEGSYADRYAENFYEKQKDISVYRDPTQENATNPDVPLDGVYSGDSVQSNDNSLSQEIIGEVFGSTKVVGNQAVILMQNSNLPVLDSSFGSSTESGGNAGEPELPWRISERMHYRDENFTECTVSDDVREIGRFAYARSGLRDLVLPDGLETIEYAAFYHCDFLTDVKLPESVTTVESKAFAHTAWVDNFMNGRDGTEGDFLVSGGVLIAYRGSSDEVLIPEGVRVVAGEAFADHREIKKLSIPASVQYIDDSAFSGCSIEEINYAGTDFSDKFDDMLMEEQIKLGEMGAAPANATVADAATAAGRAFPITWVVAAVFLLGGSVCMLWKVR